MNQNGPTAISEIIGFDLGHGETSLALAGAVGNAEPELLRIHGKATQITALAKDGDGKTFIGEEALYEPGVTEFDVCFKRPPDHDMKYRQRMRDYVKAVHEHLRETAQLGQNGSSHYFVGCPSGWQDEVVKAYEAVLRESGVTNLSVVKESHAALVHAKESGQLTVAQLTGPLLVIDLGSSTTDFTFSKDRQSASQSTGYDLGGALIDRTLLLDMLYRQAQCAELEALLKHSVPYNKCLIKCRQAKEAYFSNPERFKKSLYEDSAKLQKARFEIEIDAATMAKIMGQALPELHGRTWEQAFREAATTVKRDWIDPLRMPTGVILATGGASRMGFIQEACADIFPNWQYQRGADPEHAIARGLARWGRVEVRTRGFDADLRQLLDTQVAQIVTNALPQLTDKLCSALTDGIMADVIKCGLHDWRDGRVPTLNDLEGHMQHHAKEWASSSAIQPLLKQCVDDWLQPVQEALYEVGKPVCEKYQLPPSVLRLRGVHYQPGPWDPKVPVGDPTTLSDLIGQIVVVVLGAIVVITIAAASITFIGGLIAAGVSVFAAEQLEAQLKQRWMPLPLRRKVLGDDKIERVCRDHRSKVEEAVRNALQNDDQRSQKLVQNIITTLQDGLQQRIDEARLLIK